MEKQSDNIKEETLDNEELDSLSTDDLDDELLIDDDDDDLVFESTDDLLDVRKGYSAHSTMGHESAMQAYMAHALKYELLTKEQEIEYAKRAQAGDKEAFNAMMLANLRLVVKVARKYAHSNMPIEDLVAEGNIGLMAAIERYDTDLGFRFSTYSHHWIRQSITRAIGNQSRTVRWPIHVVQKEYTMRKKIREWNKEEYAFTEQELANALEMSLTQLEALKNLNRVENSLNEPSRGEDDERTLQDSLYSNKDDVDESKAAFEQEQKHLKVIMAKVLTPREDTVISMRFGFGNGSMTLDQIAAQYGLTRERIRQIESLALRKLRRHLSLNGMHVGDFIDDA